jgi:uncharacterized phiE125 gp8 family phage protein
MGLIRTVDPQFEPLTLEEAKAHLRVDVDVEDELIMALIVAARGAAEDYTLRALVTQTWRLTIDYCWPYVEEGGSCFPRIVLPRPPVASVSSISYVDLNGDTLPLAADQYMVYKRDTGETAIEPAYDVIWPDVRDVPAAITVEFVAGVASAAVPQPIKQAMLLLIGHLYEHREAVNVGNIVNVMPLATQWLLDPYRVHPYR